MNNKNNSDIGTIEVLIKYRTIAEIIGATLFFVGLWAKYNLFVGAKWLIISGAVIWGMWYFFYARYFKHKKDIDKKNQLITIFYMYGLAMSIIGLLFTVEMWPAYRALLLTGIIASGIGGIFIVLKLINKFSIKSLLNLLKVLIISGMAIVANQLPPETLIENLYVKDQEFVRLFLRYRSDKQNPIYYEEYKEYRNEKGY